MSTDYMDNMINTYCTALYLYGMEMKHWRMAIGYGNVSCSIVSNSSPPLCVWQYKFMPSASWPRPPRDLAKWTTLMASKNLSMSIYFPFILATSYFTHLCHIILMMIHSKTLIYPIVCCQIHTHERKRASITHKNTYPIYTRHLSRHPTLLRKLGYARYQFFEC